MDVNKGSKYGATPPHTACQWQNKLKYCRSDKVMSTKSIRMSYTIERAQGAATSLEVLLRSDKVDVNESIIEPHHYTACFSGKEQVGSTAT